MNKMLSVIVAAMFAASSAFVALPAGAQTKDEKAKTEKAKTDKAKTDKSKAKTDKSKAKTDKSKAKTDKSKSAAKTDAKKKDEVKK